MLRTEIDIFHAICEKAGTPLAYKAALAVDRGEWLKVIEYSVRPESYTCPATFALDAQIVAFFRKHPGLPLGVDRKKAAVRNFWQAEQECYRTNERLSPLLFDLEHYGEAFRSLIRVWRKKVVRILGQQPPSFDELTDLMRFGPGSTFRNTGNTVTLADKLSDGYTRTSPLDVCVPYWSTTTWGRHASNGSIDVFGDYPESQHGSNENSFYANRSFEIVRGNRFTTVPKDAKKDRGICVEPSLNVAYQLAVGTYITRCMKRVIGWDKRTAQEYHKLLARIGSLTGAVATIDLSMASDTMALNLVKLVLPDTWFDLLDRLRSPFTKIEGHWVRLEKFSSMGNGFTFELETLLFRTLADTIADLCGVREDAYTPGLVISVFGDDIIAPTSIAGTLISALRFFGFTPNETKTFVKGPFRESCGGDYFAGFDVRPHYQEDLVNEPSQIISLANGIYRASGRLRALGHDGVYRRSWFKCLDSLPSHIRRLRGPAELGDLVIADENWAMYNPMRIRNGIRYLSTWRPVANGETPWIHFRPGVVVASALFNCRGTVGEVTHRRYPLSSPEHYENVVRGLSADISKGMPTRVNGSYISGYKVGRVAYS